MLTTESYKEFGKKAASVLGAAAGMAVSTAQAGLVATAKAEISRQHVLGLIEEHNSNHPFHRIEMQTIVIMAPSPDQRYFTASSNAYDAPPYPN